jgi:acyl-CoA thioester hydrolase
MFEVQFQTYWADMDPAGIVFFPNFFRYVEQAEAEMYRANGASRAKLLNEHGVWLPRVETFAKFFAPIRDEVAIRVRINPSMKGHKTIRYDFEIFNDEGSVKLAQGYVTVVCVDRVKFKSTPIPKPIREALGL